ncbi:MAG: hypothetical protein NZ602_13920 [Thermoguttaceae bacterium]|nr:hypothetical protein [Thermoguttaceae bacterium]
MGKNDMLLIIPTFANFDVLPEWERFNSLELLDLGNCANKRTVRRNHWEQNQLGKMAKVELIMQELP